MLHNFLITRSERLYAPLGTFDKEIFEKGTITPGSWCEESSNLTSIRSENDYNRNPNTDTKMIRLELKEYFGREGEVPWQYNFI